MGIMIEIIGSLIIIGVVMLSIFGLSSNLNQASYNKNFSLVAQTNTVALARMIEFDIDKIAYHFAKPSVAMLAAKPDSISFKGDLKNTGTVNTVQYYLGPVSGLTTTKNPRDRMLYRVEDGKAIGASMGVTSLSFLYYNSNGYATSAPDSVRSIRVKFTLESPSPVDTTYATLSWEKRFYPKNL